MSRTFKQDFDDETPTWPHTNGLITTGKFEGEPSWIPMLWDRALAGFSDVSVHDGSMAIDGFKLDSNMAILTGLEPKPGHFLCLWSDDQGFISHMIMSEEQLHDCEGMDIGAGDYVNYDDPFDGPDIGGEAGY